MSFRSNIRGQLCTYRPRILGNLHYRQSPLIALLMERLILLYSINGRAYQTSHHLDKYDRRSSIRIFVSLGSPAVVPNWSPALARFLLATGQLISSTVRNYVSLGITQFLDNNRISDKLPSWCHVSPGWYALVYYCFNSEPQPRSHSHNPSEDLPRSEKSPINYLQRLWLACCVITSFPVYLFFLQASPMYS